jgi:hypothetical protein
MNAPRLLWVAAIVLVVPGAIVNALLDYRDAIDLVAGFGFALLGLSAATTGAVVATRVPANAVGWIILAIGLGVGILLAAGAYGEAGLLTDAGPLPLDEYALWLSNWVGIPVFFGLTGFLLLLFPTGRLLSPGWLWPARAFALIVAVATVGYALSPEPISDVVANPFAVDSDIVGVSNDITDLLALPGLGMCVLALVIRMRRSQGAERLQLKWFTYAAAVAGAGLAGSVVVQGGLLGDAVFLLGLLGVALMPVSAGVAILRYRLYEIDLVIRRTLVYGALTASLGGTYLLLVLLIGLTLGESNVAVAASTLAVAALFRPARARIQDLVDRRFYRRRYDAGRTLEAFGARLRDEVDLETLAADLRGVVQDTVQPAHVSLWLRSAR